VVRARASERGTAAAKKAADAASQKDVDPVARAPQATASPDAAVEALESVEKCINCRFYDRRHARPLDGKAPLWGQCRRQAPQLNPNPINAKAYVVEGIWPLVRDDDWCGEWKIILRAEEWLPESPPAPAEELPPIISREPRAEPARAEAALGDD
jgi:hypothetical protein